MCEGAAKAGLNAKVAVLHYWMDVRVTQREAMIFTLQEPSTAVEHQYICF